MDSERKFSQMGIFMKEDMQMVNHMGGENILGKSELFMKVNFYKVFEKEMEY